jgi:hypothetical protein
VVPSAQYSGLPEPYRSQALAGRAERTLVLRRRQQAPPDTAYTLTIPAGAYGEGPNASKALTSKFRTYPPLTLTARTAAIATPGTARPAGASPSAPAPRSSTTPSCPSACA